MKREREYREITADDVGRSTFKAFGRNWPTENFIGQIMSVDVGKRVYRTSERVVSVESSEQFKARRAAEIRSSEPNGSNAAKVANLVYGLLSGIKGLGIDLVRPPNPVHGHAVAVLFADGDDVVIRFESGER
jgi:hypothetical protein